MFDYCNNFTDLFTNICTGNIYYLFYRLQNRSKTAMLPHLGGYKQLKTIVRTIETWFRYRDIEKVNHSNRVVVKTCDL